MKLEQVVRKLLPDKNKKVVGKIMVNDISLQEACKILKKSRRTVSRYISNGILNPKKVKSDKGSLEYRFELKEVENFKISGKVARTDRQAIRQDTGQNKEVITLLKETTQVLRNQLNVKDKQIKSLGNKIDGLIERSRETNILIKGLTNKVLMLEGKTEKAKTVNEWENKDKDREDRQDKKRQDRGQKISLFFRRLFKGTEKV